MALMGGMQTNPILDELNNLSPEAKQALLTAHGAGAAAAAAPAPPPGPAPLLAPKVQPAQDAGPAPAMTSPMMAPQSAGPQLVPPAMPNVSEAPDQPHMRLAQDTAELGRKVDTGSGVSQIMGKVENSGFGQRHPLLGKILGGAAQGAATIGDIGLSTLLPQAAQVTPGTLFNHTRQVRQDQRQVAGDQAAVDAEAENAQREAGTDRLVAETAGLPTEQADKHAKSGAETANLESETNARENPQPSFVVHDTEDGPLLVNPKTGDARHLSVDGTPVGPKIKLTQSQPIIGQDGKPHTYMLDEQGNKKVDLGVHYERPVTTNINTGVTALDREAKQYGTMHQKSLDAANAQLEKIEDARSMINGNAEAQGLGIPKVLTALVGGQGTGVRITQAELQSIAHARGLAGDVEGTLSKWAGKGALSKAQQAQLTQIMDDVKARILVKQGIASDALDTINGASSRDQIIAADKSARQKLQALEMGQGGGGPQVFTDGDVTYHIPADQVAEFKKDHPNAR